MGSDPLSFLTKALGGTLGYIVIVIFFPAILALQLCTVLSMILVSLVFGSPPSNGGYSNPIAIGTGYLALSLSVVAAVAVALFEAFLIVRFVLSTFSN